MAHRQRVVPANEKPAMYGWRQMEVRTEESHNPDLLKSKTIIAGTGTFVDIHLEEYVGVSRRAKYTSVRLEEEAARELLRLLKLQFGG